MTGQAVPEEEDEEEEEEEEEDDDGAKVNKKTSEVPSSPLFPLRKFPKASRDSMVRADSMPKTTAVFFSSRVLGKETVVAGACAGPCTTRRRSRCWGLVLQKLGEM